MSDAPTIGERYARASVTQDLRMHDHQCDADKLLAAGYAQSGSDRKMLGLRLYRMQTTGDRAAVATVLEQAVGWINGRAQRKGMRPMPAHQRQALVVQALQWWLNQTCLYCNGTGFDVLEGTPALSMQACAGCEGTGRTPLRRAVPHRLLPHAEWLVREWDVMCAEVIGDMARILAETHDVK